MEKTSVGKPNKSEKRNAEDESEKQGGSGLRKIGHISMKEKRRE